MLKVISAILVLPTIVSCATMVSYEDASESLRKAVSCCDSIAQFSYTPLVEDGGVSFRLDASSDAFNFQSGKSYFRAFRLPEKALPYRIRVTSSALGEHIRKAHIFFPHVALLDARFTTVWQSDAGDFTLSKAGTMEPAEESWGLPVRLEGTVLINDPDAKYVLVFTTQALMRRASPYKTLRVVPVILPGVVGAIPLGKETVYIRHSPFGLLQLEIARVERE